MRLHRLELNAFGPFAGTEEVDFEELGAAGLYLVHGPTGAGKTTVLDAVCFALYGQVPGSRRGRGGLRSDHAPADVVPRVRCEFSVGERRLEITRSPEWYRPKRRGSGTVREQARAVLRERRSDGEWEPVSHRLDEIGDVVLDLVGMGVDQFTALVLLPQGEFAAFLRAPSQERLPMLERLFQTQRFAQVETWLKKHRQQLHADVSSAEAETSTLVALAASAAAVLPDHPLPAGIEAGADDRTTRLSAMEAADVVRGLAAQCSAAVTDAAAGAEAAATRLLACTTTLRQAEAEHDRQERRTALQGRLEVLGTEAPEQRDRRARLEGALAARGVAGRMSDLEAAEEHRDATAGRLSRAGETASAAGEAVSAGRRALTKRAVDLREQLGALVPVVRDESALHEAQRELENQQRALDDVRSALSATDGVIRQVGAEVDDLTLRLHSAEGGATALGARQEMAERARTTVRDVLARDRLRHEVSAVDLAERDAVRNHQTAQDLWLELRERRLAGMAAELASHLTDDTECPVCGAKDHPRPATAQPGHVTRAQEDEARSDAESAASRRDLAEGRSRMVHEALAVAEGRAGDIDAVTAQRLSDEADSAVAASESAAADARGLADQLQLKEGQRSQLVRARAEAQEAADCLRIDLTAVAERRAGLQDRVDAARGDDADVATRHRRLTGVVAAVEELAAALRDAEEADAAVRTAQERGRAAAVKAGFPDLAAAAAARLGHEELARLAAEADAYDDDVARVRALLDDPHLAAPSTPLVQIDPLRAAEREAAEAERSARSTLTRTADAAERLAHLAVTLERHARRTGPLQREYDVVDSLSRCAEGSGGDNTMRMRLSAFVLAARLEQVADAANVRLLSMSGGRYTLVHTDARAHRGALSGLGLAVIDGWTGAQRDTSSLSGGEAFYASLALALGLADVLTDEAGGTTIDTLLVDEGFGSLDADTLDEVMDVLDGLRAGGRAVGLVSHVSDLKDRIPTRLEVVKTRSGSRLRLGSETLAG